MREKKTLAWASVSHFFIDFLCAWLITHQLIENGSWFFLLFLYNFLAFAAQLPLGILLDALCTQRMAGRAGAMGRLLQGNARLITAGTGCLFCGAALLPGIGHLPLVLLCGTGNAMFHVGTGSDLLERSEGKSWPSGLFVSTGAVGIFAGALVPLSDGGRTAAGCILILLCMLLFLVCRRSPCPGMHGNSTEHAGHPVRIMPKTSRESRRRVRTADLCTVPWISARLYRDGRGNAASAVLFCVCSDLPVSSRICPQKKAGKEDSGLKEEEEGWL